MDEGRVEIRCQQFRRRVDLAVADQDGVALGVTGAAVVAIDLGAVFLVGMILGDRTGDQIHSAVFAVQRDLEVGLRILAALGHDRFLDDQLRIILKVTPGLSVRVVHAADLGGLHGELRAFAKVHFRHRIDDALARPLTGANVLFLIEDFRILIQHEVVDTVVAGVILAVRVHAAARDDHNVRPFADMEIIVDQVVDMASGDAGRDVDLFSLRKGIDVDIQSLAAFFGLDAHMLGGFSPRALAVRTDIEGPVVFAAAVVV